MLMRILGTDLYIWFGSEGTDLCLGVVFEWNIPPLKGKGDFPKHF